MKFSLKTLLILLFTCFFACEKTDISPKCQLTKFTTFTTSSNVTHSDNLTFKNGKIDLIYSYDYRHINKDTINKTYIFYIYNADGLIKQLRDESPNKRLYTFDFEHDASGNPVKVLQKTDGVLVDELTVKYKNDLLETVNTTSLIGLNRTMNYDEFDNPKTMIRYDTNPVSFFEHTFDTQNNFFAGVPEIKYLWIARPLFNFLPFGNHNILSVRAFFLRGSSLVEDPTFKSTRVLEYNAQGFPTNIKRLNDNANNAILSESKFEYNCR